MHILVTGAAGFVGFHFAKQLLADGHSVVGFDNLNGYYDVTLKEARLSILKNQQNFRFYKGDLANTQDVQQVFDAAIPDIVVHLGAQAGVRYSLENPQAYIDSNVTGTGNILEQCRRMPPKHLLYASSSSVYGRIQERPYREDMTLDRPVSTYAATKIANEAQVSAYAHMFNLRATGLRFFTVYGPWGRPDMAFFKFTRAILAGEPLDIYNHGQMLRDYTYIDDIIGGMARLMVLDLDAAPRHEVYNIGNGRTVILGDCIKVIEHCTGRKALINSLPMQLGDVEATHADTAKLHNAVHFKPSIDIDVGIANFVSWYKTYYKI